MMANVSCLRAPAPTHPHPRRTVSAILVLFLVQTVLHYPSVSILQWCMRRLA